MYYALEWSTTGRDKSNYTVRMFTALNQDTSSHDHTFPLKYIWDIKMGTCNSGNTKLFSETARAHTRET
jgi:hypothetical protein